MNRCQACMGEYPTTKARCELAHWVNLCGSCLVMLRSLNGELIWDHCPDCQLQMLEEENNNPRRAFVAIAKRIQRS